MTRENEKPAEEPLEGEVVRRLPPNVRPLHPMDRGAHDEEHEGHKQRPPSKEEAKRKQDEERAKLIRIRAEQQQQEEQAEGRCTEIRRYELTDVGNAKRLEQQFGASLRYVFPWKEWLYHDGVRWRRDTTGRIYDCAKRTVELIPL